MRANLPAAVFATFVSNPLATPAILLAGYHLGMAALDVPAPLADSALANLPLMERLTTMGEPLLVGPSIMATGSALLCYVGGSRGVASAGSARLARQRRHHARRR